MEREDQAAILANPKSRRYFEPFLGRENSVASASRELNCSVETMTYRTKTFLQADLLKVVHDQKRRGRSIKHYRAVADVFFLPFVNMGQADVRETLQMQYSNRLEPLVAGIARVVDKSQTTGQYFYCDPEGEVWLSGSPPEKQPQSVSEMATALDAFGELHLTKEQATQLKQELSTLVDRYLELSKSKQKETQHFGYGLLLASLEN